MSQRLTSKASVSAGSDRWQSLNRQQKLQIFAGACAIAISVGLIRSDFGIVAELMVKESWIQSREIGFLAALNMLGFLLGSFHQSQIRHQYEIKLCLTLAVLVGFISLLLAGLNAGLIGEAMLRVTAGWSGGHLLGGIPSLALTGLPSAWRRRASAAVLGGGGAGGLIGAAAIAQHRIATASSSWEALAVINLLLAAPVLWLIRTMQLQEFQQESEHSLSVEDSGGGTGRQRRRLLWLLGIGLFLAGAGRVPLFVYEPLVESHALGASGAISIGFAGSGALLASVLLVLLPASIATHWMLPLTAAVGLSGMAVYATASSLPAFLVTGFLLGAWGVSISSCTLAQLPRLTSVSSRRRIWALFTTLQSLSFLLFSMLTAPLADGRLTQLLQLGLVVFVVQLIVELLYAWKLRHCLVV